jgi:hypothetical protein
MPAPLPFRGTSLAAPKIIVTPWAVEPGPATALKKPKKAVFRFPFSVKIKSKFKGP